VLLILNRKSDYFPNLHQVLVYPGASSSSDSSRAGNPVLQSYATQTLTGESWTHGRVVISWKTRSRARRSPTTAQRRDPRIRAPAGPAEGYANGAPWLGSRHRYPRWSQVLSEEFARLQQSTFTGEPSLFNPTAPRIPRILRGDLGSFLRAAARDGIAPSRALRRAC
jgi:Mlc titration factor MtfA (ptsG expression regulator)